MNHEKARAAFEAEIQNLLDPAVARRCAHLLRAVASSGGVVTEHDLRRLYGHLDPAQMVVAFVQDTRLPPDVDPFRPSAKGAL